MIRAGRQPLRLVDVSRGLGLLQQLLLAELDLLLLEPVRKGSSDLLTLGDAVAVLNDFQGLGLLRVQVKAVQAASHAESIYIPAYAVNSAVDKLRLERFPVEHSRFWQHGAGLCTAGPVLQRRADGRKKRLATSIVPEEPRPGDPTLVMREVCPKAPGCVPPVRFSSTTRADGRKNDWPRPSSQKSRGRATPRS